MKKLMKTVAVTALCLLVGGGAGWAGTLTGKVLFKGNAPKAKIIKMGQDDYCLNFYQGMSPPRSEAVAVGGGGSLKWVFVYVQQGIAKKFKPPAEAAVLGQKGCMYAPRVSGMIAGQKLKVSNGDRTKHNFHLLGKNKYNRSAGPGKTITRKVKKAARLKLRKGKSRVMTKVKCDIHPWMVAYVAVMPHPFFSVTGQAGTFAIKDLPAGEYTIAAWHQKLGTRTAQVTVPADGAVTVNFEFSK